MPWGGMFHVKHPPPFKKQKSIAAVFLGKPFSPLVRKKVTQTQKPHKRNRQYRLPQKRRQKYEKSPIRSAKGALLSFRKITAKLLKAMEIHHIFSFYSGLVCFDTNSTFFSGRSCFFEEKVI